MNHRLLTPNLKAVIENYPLYSQDNKGLDAVVGEVFGIGRARWYILEASYEGEDIIMFGIVNGLGPDIEYGYISLTELEDIEVKPILTSPPTPCPTYPIKKSSTLLKEFTSPMNRTPMKNEE